MYPSLRALLRQESILQERIRRIAVSATGRSFSLSAVQKWTGGHTPWPKEIRNPVYRFITTIMRVDISRGEFNRLIAMSNEEIRNAEAEYDHPR